MFDRIVLVILNFVLVFDDLAVQFVHQQIDGSIKVLRNAFNVNVFAGHM